MRIVGVVDDGPPATFGSDFRLLTEIVTKIGTSELTINDWIVNNGGTERDFASFHHINVGEPVKDNGAQLVHAFESVTARQDGFSNSVSNPKRFGKFDSVQPNETEKVLFCVPLVGKDGKTKVMARNAEGSLGLSIEFDPKRLPYTHWENLPGASAIAFEPGTHFSDFWPKELKAKRIKSLPPGENYPYGYTLSFLTSPHQIRTVRDEIDHLRWTGSDGKIYHQTKFFPVKLADE